MLLNVKGKKCAGARDLPGTCLVIEDCSAKGTAWRHVPHGFCSFGDLSRAPVRGDFKHGTSIYHRTWDKHQAWKLPPHPRGQEQPDVIILSACFIWNSLRLFHQTAVNDANPSHWVVSDLVFFSVVFSKFTQHSVPAKFNAAQRIAEFF